MPKKTKKNKPKAPAAGPSLPAFWAQVRDPLQREARVWNGKEGFETRMTWRASQWSTGNLANVSGKLGISRQYLARVLKGTRWPSFENLVKIAAHYGYKVQLVKAAPAPGRGAR